MKGTYFGNNRMLVRLEFGNKFLVTCDDLSVSPEIAMNGVYEVPLSMFMINTLKPGNVVVDVGANQGYFTILASRLVGQAGNVIAYEANPTLYSVLKDNININYYTVQTEAHNKAIYSEKTNLTFKITKRFSANSSIFDRENYLETHEDEIEEINVETETIDSLYERFPSINLVKLDIEGAEFEAFKGMEKMLKSGAIKMVVFEWNRDMLKERAEEFYQFLEENRIKWGMDYYYINNDGTLLPMNFEEAHKEDFIPFMVLKQL